MNEAYSFATQARVGKAGEREVIAWLQRAGYAVEDVSSDPEWQARDVDLILDGSVWAEVKTDSHPPAHIFVELSVDGKPGYLYKARADILLYYFSGYRKLFWLYLPKLVWWVHEHTAEYRRIQIRSKRGGSEWLAEGIVVSLAELREAGVVKDEWDLDEGQVYGRVA